MSRKKNPGTNFGCPPPGGEIRLEDFIVDRARRRNPAGPISGELFAPPGEENNPGRKTVQCRVHRRRKSVVPDP